MQTIVIAADHAGFELKQKIILYLKGQQYNVLDLGCDNMDAVDYPDYASRLCQNIGDRYSTGILICGSGIGMSIAANRFKHIRAALCADADIAQLSREHNDANVLVLGARIIDQEVAFSCINKFLNTEFKGGKHQIRVGKL
jgi:ribose 5-phosphate isomerase B